MTQVSIIAESRLQADCFQWHWNTFPNERGLLFTVDNNANDRVKGNIKKAMGRIAGVADMMYLTGRTLIAIELKLPNGVQSMAQLAWEGKLEESGYAYFVVRSLDQFKQLITDLQILYNTKA